MAFIGGIFILMFVVTAGVIVALAISGFQSANRQNQKRLGDGAKRIGLEVDSGKLDAKNMSGKIKGFEVKVEKTLNTETVKVRYPRALGIGLCLTHQSYYDRAARWLGNQDIEVGDEEFDRRVVVQGDQRRVAPFLTEERRTKILELFDLDDAFMIMDRGISLKNVGRPLPSSELSDYLKKMVEVATVLTQKEKAQRRRKRKKKPTPPPPLPVKKEAPDVRPSEKDEFYEEYGVVLKDALSLVRQQAATGKISGRNAELIVSAAMVANRDFEGAARILAKLKEAGPSPVVSTSAEAESTLTNPLPQSTEATLVEEAESLPTAEGPPSDKVETAIEERIGDDSETTIEERKPEPEPEVHAQQTDQIGDEKGTDESSEEVTEEPEEERDAEETEAESDAVSDEEEAASASELEGEASSPVPEEQEPVQEGPGATTLCKELFSSMSSSAAVKKFESDYTEAEVCWSGTLQRIETFITDRIFDQDTELVAVFSLVDPDDRYATRLADALVSFPKEAEADLRPHVGRMMEFTGTLFQVQPFMRNLYLKNGCVAVEAT